MIQEKIRQGLQIIKQNLVETFRLLWSFKWYILVYLVVYCDFLLRFLMPSSKNYFIWERKSWYVYEEDIYLEGMGLLLAVLALLFLVGTSNMRNHPLLAKIIFLSPICLLPVFWRII